MRSTDNIRLLDAPSVPQRVLCVPHHVRPLLPHCPIICGANHDHTESRPSAPDAQCTRHVLLPAAPATVARTRESVAHMQDDSTDSLNHRNLPYSAFKTAHTTCSPLSASAIAPHARVQVARTKTPQRASGAQRAPRTACATARDRAQPASAAASTPFRVLHPLEIRRFMRARETCYCFSQLTPHLGLHARKLHLRVSSGPRPSHTHPWPFEHTFSLLLVVLCMVQSHGRASAKKR